jgi:hypothetical protein
MKNEPNPTPNDSRKKPPTPPPSQPKNIPVKEPEPGHSDRAYFQGTDRTQSVTEGDGDATEEDERR